jgi:glycosyltransferase involved in cell wall biosynthesis
MTAPAQAPPPPGFELNADEADLSARFARLLPLPGTVSEYLLRLWLALSLLLKRRRYDAVVTGRYGEFFAVLQSLWPFGRRPHLLLDVEWYAAHTSGWRRRLNRELHRRVGSCTTRIQVFCRVEARNYSEGFAIDADRFIHIPYCCDLPNVPPVFSNENYIFTGGLHHRDYDTLLQAARHLPVELRIAAPVEHFRATTLPDNVTLLGVVQPSEYWRAMMNARLVVLSLEEGIARCPGVITYVAAMRMGKCVVVNEPTGAVDYIQDGITGFVVPPRDPAALSAVINALLENPALIEATARNALTSARQNFSGTRYWELVYHAVDEMVERGA